MDILVFKEIYLVQNCGSFDAGVSLIQKDAEQLSLLSSQSQVAVLQKKLMEGGFVFLWVCWVPVSP